MDIDGVFGMLFVVRWDFGLFWFGLGQLASWSVGHPVCWAKAAADPLEPIVLTLRLQLTQDKHVREAITAKKREGD